jgi:hypothetical protein
MDRALATHPDSLSTFCAHTPPMSIIFRHVNYPKAPVPSSTMQQLACHRQTKFRCNGQPD